MRGALFLASFPPLLTVLPSRLDKEVFPESNKDDDDVGTADQEEISAGLAADFASDDEEGEEQQPESSQEET